MSSAHLHVLRAHVGVRRTCRWADEAKKSRIYTRPGVFFTAPFGDQAEGKGVKAETHDAEFILTLHERSSNGKVGEVVLGAIDDLSRSQWLSVLTMHIEDDGLGPDSARSSATAASADANMSSSVSLTKNVRTKKTFWLVRGAGEGGGPGGRPVLLWFPLPWGAVTS